VLSRKRPEPSERRRQIVFLPARSLAPRLARPKATPGAYAERDVQ